MSIELFRAITPYVTMLLALAFGIFVFFFKWFASEQARSFKDITAAIVSLKNDIKELDDEHQNDQRILLREFIDKESYYLAVGKIDGLIEKIFHQLNENSKALHEVLGGLKEREKNK